MSIEVADAVRVALRLLESDGLDKLTVRKLASELGVKAPALYWHFAGKRALLDHMTDVIVAPVTAALPPPGEVPWARWVEDAASSLHAELLEHRDGARVALGADLRVARSLGELTERAVGVLHADAGFSFAYATRVSGVLVHFVLGRAVESQTRPDPAVERTLVSQDDFPFPLMARGMRERHAAGSTPADDFGYALEILLTGLRAIHEDGER
ncbi:TetR family transcriptional regulator [Amycolatopsis sp. CA-230715]|uniref:TetR family transcriptional regulator n=1 Tax=Amycolatopsis sp. CA-230715 TaxID=2745196 RepID=UPI001C023EFF|nr:TetR/AcrR family transcriptional regulator C-terminal domain-containing protein [Amycolatopsis sp. CA-230715]QWF84666.1 Tetracycline repressor protein class B from transposon Tn10 [Amycolatopsis sp. CA-230715]